MLHMFKTFVFLLSGHAGMYVCMYVCMYVWLYVCVYVCMYVCGCLFLCMYVCVCIFFIKYAPLQNSNTTCWDTFVFLFRYRGCSDRISQWIPFTVTIITNIVTYFENPAT